MVPLVIHDRKLADWLLSNPISTSVPIPPSRFDEV